MCDVGKVKCVESEETVKALYYSLGCKSFNHLNVEILSVLQR